ncbi:creatininase family protein [Paenibacillus sp. S-38]|uniref:creatininase family protein n=1 Tax=Paenibacillus sp. S-38 TaxID=3416710 RepID=UPI003CE9540C
MHLRFGRNEGTAWDSRFLPRCSKLEVEAIPKEEALVVLPVGAVEQHGPHLPVYTDTLIGEAFLTYAFDELPPNAQIWLLPPLPYGKSSEHLGHPGTISLSAPTLMSVLTDIASSLSRSGFRRLVLFNTHGGNADLLNLMAREIRIAEDMMVFRLDPGALGLGDAWLTEEERKAGIHAGDYETSVVLAVQESWVHRQLAGTELPKFPVIPSLLFRSKAFAWVMDDLSESGIAGDAAAASAEKGRAILELGGIRLAEALLEMQRFDFAAVKTGFQPGQGAAAPAGTEGRRGSP